MDRCSQDLQVKTMRGIPPLSRAISTAYSRLWDAAESRGGAAALAFWLLGPALDSAAALSLAL